MARIFDTPPKQSLIGHTDERFWHPFQIWSSRAGNDRSAQSRLMCYDTDLFRPSIPDLAPWATLSNFSVALNSHRIAIAFAKVANRGPEAV